MGMVNLKRNKAILETGSKNDGNNKVWRYFETRYKLDEDTDLECNHNHKEIGQAVKCFFTYNKYLRPNARIVYIEHDYINKEKTVHELNELTMEFKKKFVLSYTLYRKRHGIQNLPEKPDAFFKFNIEESEKKKCPKKTKSQENAN